jgi:hypothetical protein
MNQICLTELLNFTQLGVILANTTTGVSLALLLERVKLAKSQGLLWCSEYLYCNQK